MTNIGALTDQDCDCGHPMVAHELVTREGKAWFSVEGMEMTPDQVDTARGEGRLSLWCGHCEDTCKEAQP